MTSIGMIGHPLLQIKLVESMSSLELHRVFRQCLAGLRLRTIGRVVSVILHLARRSTPEQNLDDQWLEALS